MCRNYDIKNNTTVKTFCVDCFVQKQPIYIHVYVFTGFLPFSYYSLIDCTVSIIVIVCVCKGEYKFNIAKISMRSRDHVIIKLSRPVN